MVSFDLCSLFTNITLEETIDIAVNVILENYVGIKITKNELKQLFIYATSKTHFLFNGSIYDQIDGVAMGSPLAPVLANLFMVIMNINGSKVIQVSVLATIDFMSTTFQTEEQADLFFSYLKNIPISHSLSRNKKMVNYLFWMCY